MGQPLVMWQCKITFFRGSLWLTLKKQRWDICLLELLQRVCAQEVEMSWAIILELGPLWLQTTETFLLSTPKLLELADAY